MIDWNDVMNDVPTLTYGPHEEFGNELCFMEMVSFLAGEDHSDEPTCASPALTRFGIRLNDSGAVFRKALTPIVPLMIGTKNEALELERVEYLIFNVARRMLPSVLTGYVADCIIDAILNATTLNELREACLIAERVAGYPAGHSTGHVAYAATAVVQNTTDAAGYSAHGAVHATAASHVTPALAAQILKEAIELDPNLKPVAIDPDKVAQLKALVA